MSLRIVHLTRRLRMHAYEPFVALISTMNEEQGQLLRKLGDAVIVALVAAMLDEAEAGLGPRDAPKPN